MTSQIVLVTQSGIGIASDTLTSSTRGPDGRKTIPGANKIYELGSTHNVVVLHSGVTRLGGVDYELLVREWALQQTSPLPALTDYPRAFGEWLENFRKVPINEVGVVFSLICEAYQDFLSSLESDFLQALGTTEPSGELRVDLMTSLMEKIEQFYQNYYVDPSPFADLSDSKLNELLLSQDTDFFEHFLQDLAGAIGAKSVPWKPSFDLQLRVEELATNKLKFWNHAGSGAILVFAGFGSEEPIGGYVECNVAGFYGGRMRMRTDDRWPKTGSTKVAIGTFAQDAEIADFIRGLDSGLQESIIDVAASALSSPGEGDGLSKEQVRAFKKDFDHALDHFLVDEFTSKFRRTIDGLPLKSLVLFCEALVKLQSLRAATSADQETVGGPIDSLSIHREHGIKWRFRAADEQGLGEHTPHPFL